MKTENFFVKIFFSLAFFSIVLLIGCNESSVDPGLNEPSTEHEAFLKLISEDEVIDQISRECCNGDREKGRIAYREAVNVLREKTRRRQQQGQQQEEGEGFLDNILGSLKGRDGGSGLF